WLGNFKVAAVIARRELRGRKHGLGVFLLCLILGVTAIASVGTVSRSVVAGLDAEGSDLLGGDVSLSLHSRPFNDTERARIKDGALSLSDVMILRAMARPEDNRDRRRLVELKAVDSAYPLYGQVETSSPEPLSRLLEQRDGVWGAIADPNLFRHLGLEPGGRIRLGEAVIELRAELVREPDRVASVLSFGPRLMISSDAIPATKLIQPGSHIHYVLRATYGPDFQFVPWKETLLEQFPSAGWNIRSAEEAAPGVRRFIDRLGLFLTFIGLTVLLVGGVGVANAVTCYLEERRGTIATLKCLGAPLQMIFQTYMLQIMVMAVAGTICGLVLGTLGPFLALTAISSFLPVPPVIGFFWKPVLIAAAFGLLVAFTFALWPVARAQAISPAQLFRDSIAPVQTTPGRRFLAMAFVGVVLLCGLVFLAVDDNYFAAWFIGGSIASLAALRYSALGLMALAARARPTRAWMRLALANLYRPGSATMPVTLSLGLGLAVLVSVSVIQGNLSRQISERLPEQAPAFFFIDIQPDQVEAFDQAVTGVEGTSGFLRVPSLRGRITAIKGVPVGEVAIKPDSEWAVRGDRALTFSAALPEGSEITEGEWWPENYAGPPQISLDADLANGFGVAIGDTLTLNVLSRDITATVANLREIDWRSLRFDFAIIFAPGALDGAPFTHIAAINAPRRIEDAVERAATDGFPNISTIRVREALEAAVRILDGVNWAVRGMAGLSILSGLIVLSGAIATGQRRRIPDSGVFKVLGASRSRFFRLFTTEFMLVGLTTGVIAAGIGLIVSWAVVEFLMRMDWVPMVREAALTVGFTLLVTVLLGWFSIWKVLAGRPMPYLRNE
ncbi:MAG: FtsX-like permease family protein, partial [Rhodospirillaceae bacterium]|nr:FtsX-like permease family protein [Rhodospirillaceae bacterium]